MGDNKYVVDLDFEELRRLLRGGFTLPHDEDCGLVVLIRGKAGTGKSTLALQILDSLESTEASKHYCTLEQTEKDVRFKLASMIVAQAIDKARCPEYTEDETRFSCDLNVFMGHLRKKIASGVVVSFKNEARSCLDNIELPLYEEPDEDRREDNTVQQDKLVDLVKRNLDGDYIRFLGCNSTSEKSEKGFKASQNRVVLASGMLHELNERLAEEANKKDGKDERNKRPVAVLDGLSLLSVSERETVELHSIVEHLRRKCQLAILVYEPNESESTYLDHHVDIVIEMSRREHAQPVGYLVHEFCVRKSRYQEAALGEHQFKIRSSGIALFPSLHFQVHHHNYMDLELARSSHDTWSPTTAVKSQPETCDFGSLIDMIFCPSRGESTVLLGSRNSFKTELCLDFLSCGNWGCPITLPEDRPNRGLLISLLDNAPDIQHGLVCPWKETHAPKRTSYCRECDMKALAHVRPFCQRPGCITPSEFFYYVKKRLNEARESLDRVVFWDLTQMDYRFPLFREDKMLLPAMMDLFKTLKLRSLFMGAGNADNTRAASAMADHVLFCWRSVRETEEEEAEETSLMLYVDRTSPSRKQSGKALYRIPIWEDGTTLKAPLNRNALNGEEYRLSPMDKSLTEQDQQEIRRITAMQGVE